MSHNDASSPVVALRMTALIAVAAFALVSCASSGAPSGICLSGAGLDGDGQCRTQQADEHHIPFRAGQEVRVTQGYHGYETHRDDASYAVDFACSEGTPVTASRSGVVWSVSDSSNTGCPEPDCVEDANYVIVDHGDGTFSTYYHLQHHGAVVEPGDTVCRGQLLGLCGDTGFATGAHLHFSVLDTRWRTIPVAFNEARDSSSGVVLARQSYESQNERLAQCDVDGYSHIPRNGFVHRGIVLDDDVPMVLESDDDRSTELRGRYLGEQSHVAVHRRRISGGEWIEECAEVDDDGRFSIDVDWPPHVFPDGYYFMMLTGSDEDCSAPGWSWAYRVQIRTSDDSQQMGAPR